MCKISIPIAYLNKQTKHMQKNKQRNLKIIVIVRREFYVYYDKCFFLPFQKMNFSLRMDGGEIIKDRTFISVSSTKENNKMCVCMFCLPVCMYCAQKSY